jgi:hypothetical protein
MRTVTCLQIPTIFCLGARTTLLSYCYVHNISDVMQTEVHTAEELVPGPSHLEVGTAIAK